MSHPLDLHPCDAIARQAWNAVKQPQQPEFDDLPVGYRTDLLERAALPSSDDAFECKVRELELEPDSEPEPELESLTEPVEAELVAEVVEEEVPEPEVKEHVDLKGQLPDDFPARAKLHEAAINTYGQLAKIEDLTSIEGVGPAIAKTIHKRLKADEKTLNK